MLGTLKIYSRLSFTFLFSIIFAVLVVCVSCHCLESERNHLLQLKASLKLQDDVDRSGEKLVTWNNQSSDCCSWRGIGCSADGNVVSLDLSSEGIAKGLNDSSSLFSLQYLKSLNLAFNYFNSTFPTKFDKLINLNYLNLSYSGFSGQIPISISSLVNLQTLHISNTFYEFNSSPVKLENPNLDTLIRNLSNLQQLLLSGVIISAKDDNWGRAIASSLPNLQVLDISSCGLKGTIDLSLSKLRHLSEIFLADNDLSGVFPKEIFHLQTLRAIDLSWNGKLQGSFPEISKNNSLEELVLSYTNFSGGLPNSIIENLKSLSILEISDCWFSGALPKSLSNLTKLTHIDLSSNQLNGSIHSTSWEGLPKLKYLILAQNSLSGAIPKSLWNLTKLTHIDLFGNQLNGSIHSTRWEGLPKLKYLILARNSLSGAIPKSLSNLTKLTHIDLSENTFVGSIPSLTLLSDLTDLYLSENQLTGSIHSTHWEGLTKLEILELSTNSLNGSIPVSVFHAPSLKRLDLGSNRFSEISNEHLNISSSSSQLSYIELGSNIINGPVPYFFFRLKELLTLDLSYNNFSGPLPDIDMKNLWYLDLSSNNLCGPLPNSLFKCENLNSLSLSHNNFSGQFYTSMINRFPSLDYISLSYSGLFVIDNVVDVPSSFPHPIYVELASCRLKSFPGFLRNQSNLKYLDLSQNQISGEIPNWIWKGTHCDNLNLSRNFLEGIERPVLTVPSISILDLHSNRLRGEIPFFSQDTWYLDYSMNNFSSSIPPLIPNSDLYFFSLSNNHLNGSIPESICNSSSIQVLNLSNNSLSGPIPQCISMLNESLVVLNLGMNNLNGTISDALLPPGCQLETLDLNGNGLSGKVPESLLNCKGLQVLNLGNNHINDTFPYWLKELSNLSVLVLTSNKFHGELRYSKTNKSWPMLQIVDLSSNSFSGKLLAEWFLSWKGMMVATEFNSISNRYYDGYYQNTVTLNIKGNEVKLEKILTIYTSIDLSNNYFEGVIPQELGSLTALYCLNLSRNNFMGSIPPSLGNLKQLESLDLSRNKLSGSIPQQLANLTFLQVLNMSFNQLEGRIPRGSQFDNLCEDSFLGNKGLVGPQVKRKCKETVASPATPLHDNNTRPKKSNVRWELVAGTEVGFNVGFGIVIGSLVVWPRWMEWFFDLVERVILKILCDQNQSRPNQLRGWGGN